MSRSLVLTDFDRTLFSAKFYEAFLRLLHQRQHLSADDVTRIIKQLEESDLSMNLLDVLEQCNLNVVQAIALARKELDPDHYLYPDHRAFFQRFSDAKMVIVTGGERRWQMVKLDFCHELKPYPRIIVQENKGKYVKDTLITDARGVSIQELEGEWFDQLHLIDDRVDMLEPLVGEERVTLWHVQRPDAKYKRTANHPGIHHITSLDEVTK